MSQEYAEHLRTLTTEAFCREWQAVEQRLKRIDGLAPGDPGPAPYTGES